MNRLNHRRLRAGLLAGLTALGMALFGFGLWSGKTARAAGPAMVGDVLNYASPVEMLFSSDGTRLYVLCQQSGEVRVLDAVTYSLIKNIAVASAAPLPGCPIGPDRGDGRPRRPTLVREMPAGRGLAEENPCRTPASERTCPSVGCAPGRRGGAGGGGVRWTP